MADLERTCRRCGQVWYVPQDLVKSLRYDSSSVPLLGAVLLGNVVTQHAALGREQSAKLELGRLGRCPSCGSSEFQEATARMAGAVQRYPVRSQAPVERPQVPAETGPGRLVLKGRVEILQQFWAGDLKLEVVQDGKEWIICSQPEGIELFLGGGRRLIGSTPVRIAQGEGRTLLNGSLAGQAVFRGQLVVEETFVPDAVEVVAPKEVAAPRGVDLVSNLQHLAELYERQLLTAEEFAAFKARLLQA